MTRDLDSDLELRTALLDSWVETRRQIARLEAEASQLLADRMRLRQADAAEHPYHRDAIERSLIAEYSAAGRIPQGSIDRAFTDAAFLDSGHPAVQESFRRGSISAAHVREIVQAAGVVREAVNNKRADASVLATYDAAAVVIAETETAARTRAHVRTLAAALAGETVTKRHARARSERTVTMRSVDDGLALLQIVLPEHLATAIFDRLTQLARAVIAARKDHEPQLQPLDDDAADDRGTIFGDAIFGDAIFGDGVFTTDPTPPEPTPPACSGRPLIDPMTDPQNSPDIEHIPADTRTIDEVRTDILTDLLLAGEPSAANGTGLDNIRGRIQVTVAASTLAGCDDKPAELDGHGPLHPSIARALAGRCSGWTRLFLDPTGLVTETDSYTPTERMRRFLRARDQHCRFPGCRMPVHRCQIDHTHDHAKGGRTEIHNLEHLCTSHHVLKHPDVADEHRWTAYQLPDGSIDWISPLGRTYRDRPPRRVMFV